MIPDQCSSCYGKLRQGETEFRVHSGDEAIVIRNVPAHICEQCGEAYYTVSISRKIDEFMHDAQKKKLCMEPFPESEVSIFGEIPTKKN
jgi:YgiT-type zinc finger domain-containing protein